MIHVVLCELAAFVVYFLYTSYFEWFLHRYVFHTPKFIYSMFRKHTLVHHQIYKGDESYVHNDEDEHPEKVAMDWWALPALIAFHLPLYWAVEHFTHIPSLWGGVAAMAVYYLLYESLHWVMHVPSAMTLLGRFRAFRFLDRHHHVHHKYMLSNLNVILPLADLTLGTLRDADGNRVTLFGRKKKPAASPVEMPKAVSTARPRSVSVAPKREQSVR